MGTIWIKELTGGLDVRRLPETTPGGVLIRATDGHITRGGEFEKRASFAPTYTLPTGTVGLAYNRAGIVVFGHAAAPSLPFGVSYQRLQHSDGTTPLTRVLSFDLYDGKIYAVGLFADGSIFHFYDGVRVEDWFDGRARAQFRVTGGGITPPVAATGSFEVLTGTLGSGNQITNVRIDGVSLTGGVVAHTGDNAETAVDIADAINATTSTPNYTASAVGQTVEITAATTGAAVNGKAIVVTVGGDVTVGNVANMAGGAAETVSRLTDIKVNGVSIIGGGVDWTVDNLETAEDIADAINATTSSPNYDATFVDDRVNIIAEEAGTGENGKAISFTLANGFEVTPSTGLQLDGGGDSEDTFIPGTFVKTVGSKLYSVSDSLLHFSGIQEPTKWTTDTTGAGFINMSTQNSGSEDLVAVARYQSLLAIFAPAVVQVWFIDPDPLLNRQSQVLSNTGTSSPQSVTQFGDNDIFYLDESGIRSLRARENTNAASTTDIGVPVDDLIVAKLGTLTAEERSRVVGLINPMDKRFWLIMKDEIFVFSFFANARVSSWTTYTASVLANNGSLERAFDVTEAVVFNRRVYMRGNDDRIYVYGGLATGQDRDETVAEAWLPYLDANRPTAKKDWEGLDVALTGVWEIQAGMDPTALETVDTIANVNETTFNDGRIPIEHSSSHLSLRFRSFGAGEAILSSAVLHYRGDEIED